MVIFGLGMGEWLFVFKEIKNIMCDIGMVYLMVILGLYIVFVVLLVVGFICSG